MSEDRLEQQEETMQSSAKALPLVLPAPTVERRDKPTIEAPAKMRVQRLNFYYGKTRALKDITLAIASNQVTAFIGPSGCGKSTLIRTLNRMNDVIPGIRVEGTVELDGQDVYAGGADVVSLRRRVGMVFQKPNPFPRSIFDNVAYGLKINGLTSYKARLNQRVEEAL